MAEKNLINFLRDANDIVRLLTGKSIPDLAKRSAELFGREAARKIIEEKPPEPDTPYAVLGVRPDASTIVIKATYRMLIKGVGHGSEQYQKILTAYHQILAERGEG